MMRTFDNIIPVIKNARKITILPHISADGDALGACTGLAIALKSLNKDVSVFLEEQLPEIYGFLPGKNLTEVFTRYNQSPDLCIALDTGDIERLGERVSIFNDSRVTVNIDHHSTNTEFAFYNHVETEAPAVGEIIFRLLKELDVDINTEIALCLYVALITDTGGFRYGNTTPAAHKMAAELVEKGLDVAGISQWIFETVSIGKTMLIGEAINSLELLHCGKTAFITLTDEAMLKTGAKEEDCEGIVNIGRNIKGVEVAAVFRKKINGEIKVNLRSKSYADVSSIASMFGGGGHKRAAGFTAEDSIDNIKQMLLKDIGEVLL